jgi:hypothetical protein
MQVTGPLINHQLKERIEFRHDVLPMEDSTLLGGTWLFSDVMLLTPPPTLVSVLDCKKLYQKSFNEMHLVFSVTYHTQMGVLST